jgi:hypothetical protein
MVCVPCIFVGLAIVIWCKFLEPYLRPVYERLCQLYPPLRAVGDQAGVWLGKVEKFGEKIGIRMPQSCPMPKKNNAAKVRGMPSESTIDPLLSSQSETTKKMYPDLNAETDLHQRPTTTSEQ